MQTVYDWVTLAIFAGLVVLFLQRSTAETESHKDGLVWYLLAGAGCAVANYLGNHGQDLFAVLALVATLTLIIVVLKPFKLGRNV